MKTYLVGGAVRDRLLGFMPQERDWVVVGATPAHMLQQGFQQVGRHFPVFLHPETHEEYALARRERKVAAGYYGFTCDAAPEVTLEDDLRRRDLTINAMAMDTSDTSLTLMGESRFKAQVLAPRLRRLYRRSRARFETGALFSALLLLGVSSGS